MLGKLFKIIETYSKKDLPGFWEMEEHKYLIS